MRLPVGGEGGKLVRTRESGGSLFSREKRGRYGALVVVVWFPARELCGHYWRSCEGGGLPVRAIRVPVVAV